MSALKLAVDNTRRAMRERLIRSEYSGSYGDRVGRSCTLEGAIRAAIVKLCHGDYTTCRVFDCRFGNEQALAVTITNHPHKGVSVEYGRPRWSKN